MQCLGLAKPPEENAGDKYKVDGVPEQANMGGAAAAAGGGGMLGMMSGMLANPPPEMMSMFSSGQAPPAPDPAGSRSVFGSKAAMVAPADVIMFSGCQDDQTSADVHNVTPLFLHHLPIDGVSWHCGERGPDCSQVASFGLPPDSGPGGAGGACTNAMMLALSKNPSPTWIELLEDMRVILEEKKFTQVPKH